MRRGDYRRRFEALSKIDRSPVLSAMAFFTELFRRIQCNEQVIRPREDRLTLALLRRHRRPKSAAAIVLEWYEAMEEQDHETCP